MTHPLSSHDSGILQCGAGSHLARVTIIKATNGKLIEVSYYKPNPRGNDWEYEYTLVPEGESLVDAVSRVLTASALENS